MVLGSNPSGSTKGRWRNWQRIGLLIRWFWVRVPGDPQSPPRPDGVREASYKRLEAEFNSLGEDYNLLEVSVKRLIMENLPTSQKRQDLDTLVSGIFCDLQQLDENVDLHSIYRIIKVLHDEQDLFIFSDGTVAATKKGLNKYG